jgi:site-specific recombinase XerD
VTEFRPQIDSYLSYMRRLVGARPNTLTSYKSTLHNFEQFVGSLTVEEVDADIIIDFLERPRCADRREPSASTRKRERGVLDRFWEWMRRSGVVATDPMWMVPAPKVFDVDPNPMADEDWLKLWTSNLPADDRLWLGLGYFCGMRRFEIATIAPSEVDVRQGVMRFLRKGGSRAALEYVELVRTIQQRLPKIAVGTNEWLELLAWTVRSRSDMSFLVSSSKGVSEAADGQYFTRRMRILMRELDLPPEAGRPHRLRHSCATNLLRCRVPIEIVADQLNHVNIQTTRRYLKTSGQLGLWRDENTRPLWKDQGA